MSHAMQAAAAVALLRGTVILVAWLGLWIMRADEMLARPLAKGAATQLRARQGQ